MSIEIKITGDDVQEVAKQLFSLGFIMSGRAAAPATMGSGPMTTGNVEAVRNEETVERVDDGGAAAEAVVDDVEVVEAVEEADPAGGEAEPEPDHREAVEDAEVVDVEAEPIEDEPAPVDDEPAMSVDELRAYALRNYLLKNFKDLAEQKAAWESMMSDFGVKKLTELPEDKLKEFKRYVDRKIAEIS